MADRPGIAASVPNAGALVLVWRTFFAQALENAHSRAIRRAIRETVCRATAELSPLEAKSRCLSVSVFENALVRVSVKYHNGIACLFDLAIKIDVSRLDDDPTTPGGAGAIAHRELKPVVGRRHACWPYISTQRAVAHDPSALFTADSRKVRFALWRMFYTSSSFLFGRLMRPKIAALRSEVVPKSSACSLSGPSDELRSSRKLAWSTLRQLAVYCDGCVRLSISAFGRMILRVVPSRTAALQVGIGAIGCSHFRLGMSV